MTKPTALLLGLLLSIQCLAQDGRPSPTEKPRRPIKMPTDGCLSPEYPLQARRSGAEGTTRIFFAIEQDGSVSNVKVAKGSGATKEHTLLDEAAAQSIRRCNFGEAQDFSPVRAAQDFKWKLEPHPLAPRPASSSK